MNEIRSCTIIPSLPQTNTRIWWLELHKLVFHIIVWVTIVVGILCCYTPSFFLFFEIASFVLK